MRSFSSIQKTGFFGLSFMISLFTLKVGIAAPPELKNPSPSITPSLAAPAPIVAAPISPSPSPLPSPSLSPSAPAIQQISLDRTEKGKVFFKPPAKEPVPPPFETGFSSLKLVGTLKASEGKNPYFLLEGKGCADCSEVSQLVLVRPFSTRQSTFVYPGTIHALQANQPIVLQSRAFFGKCLPDREEAYIVLNTEHVDRKRRHAGRRVETNITTVILEMQDDYPREQTISHRSAAQQKSFLSKILAQVRTKNCAEITGQERTVMKKPFNLKTRDEEVDDDDEDDSKVDETASLGTKPE